MSVQVRRSRLKTLTASKLHWMTVPMSPKRLSPPDPKLVPTSPKGTTDYSKLMSSPSPLLTTRPASAPSMSIGTWVPSTTPPVSTTASRTPMTNIATSWKTRRPVVLPPFMSAGSLPERPARDSSATFTIPTTKSSPSLMNGNTATSPWRLDRPTRFTGRTLPLDHAELLTNTKLLSTMVFSATWTWKLWLPSNPKTLPRMSVFRPKSLLLLTTSHTTTPTLSKV
mmetsp:Transcript_1600/g.3547  ORF Transcript_1600/g.3547 Transcript_1600/m.3547 type:complete len:225 (-) Transcript_1600:581-1255(-)